jgi:uncharacterized OB-fold protein
MTNEMIAERPLPEITPLTEPFWRGAQERRLMVQRCNDCSDYRFPPEIYCLACGSENGEWVQASGRATLYSWTVGHPPMLPYFMERAPWPVAVVQLEEGPRMVTNIVDAPPDDYEIGMALTVDFEDVDDDVTLPVFRRAQRRPGS